MNNHSGDQAPYFVKLFGLAALYVLLAKLVLTCFSVNGVVSIVWPSSGLALAALLVGGRRYAWGVMLGAFAANLLAGAPLTVAGGIALGNTLEAFAGYWLLNHPAGFDVSLRSQRSYLRLLALAGGLSSVVAAVIGSTTLLLLGGLPADVYLQNLVFWWMGDALGIILIAPLILVWRHPPRQWLRPGRLIEAVLLFGLSLLACQVIFMGWVHELASGYAKVYLMFLFVTIAAVRFGKHGVLLILLMTSSSALYGALHGQGFFADDIANTHLTGYWLYITILTVVGMVLSTYIIEHRHAEEDLKKNDARFRFMLETSPIAVRIASSAGRKILLANQRYAQLINAGSDMIVGQDPQNYYADPQVYTEILRELDAGLAVNERLVELIVPGGRNVWVIATYLKLEYENEPAVLGWFYDISDLKQTQEALRVSEQAAKKSLEELKYQKFALDEHAIVAVTDVQGRITYANKKFSEISGYTQEELIGRDHDILNSGYHPKGTFREMYRVVANGNVWHGEICNRAKDGHLYWVDTTVAPYIGDDGKPQNYISIRTDITKRVKAEEKSNYLALYDPLTNLPNRRLLMDRLNQAIASSMRSGKEGALLFIDLDNFKTINDTLGHDFGDLLLQEVSKRLTACVREGDTVARLGGDEFLVMLEGLSELPIEAAAQTEVIADKILSTLNQPFQLQAHEYRSGGSIGVVLFSGHDQAQDELLRHADIAMYQAKKEGRNAVRFFDPEMQGAINTRVLLENDLRLSVEKQQLHLYYQIQINSAGRPIGAEALIRWLHPQRGPVSPAQFIPLAEETRLILPIGLWVLETACIQIRAWQQRPQTRDIKLAVNVSAKQFEQPDFVSQVLEVIQRTGADPARLKLELTESLLAGNVETIIEKMAALKAQGVLFSLDDFGTGFSSLSYLKRLPLDQLKIDQSFVRDVMTDPNDAAIVRTVIALGQSLGLAVIAEGVETEEQRNFLDVHGCANYQGYFFSKPLPLPEFETLLVQYWQAESDQDTGRNILA